jgi:hypothetical protein
MANGNSLVAGYYIPMRMFYFSWEGSSRGLPMREEAIFNILMKMILSCSRLNCEDFLSKSRDVNIKKFSNLEGSSQNFL